jgi:hypothetical protein
VLQIEQMPKKKTNKSYDREAYRKAARQTRVKGVLAERIDQYIAKSVQDFGDFVNQAVREKLEELGFWPDWPEGYPKPLESDQRD